MTVFAKLWLIIDSFFFHRSRLIKPAPNSQSGLDHRPMPKNKNMLEIAVLYNNLFRGWCLWLLVLQFWDGRSWCHCSHKELAQPTAVRGNQPSSFIKMFHMNRSDKKKWRCQLLWLSCDYLTFLSRFTALSLHRSFLLCGGALVFQSKSASHPAAINHFFPPASATQLTTFSSGHN